MDYLGELIDHLAHGRCNIGKSALVSRCILCIEQELFNGLFILRPRVMCQGLFEASYGKLVITITAIRLHGFQTHIPQCYCKVALDYGVFRPLLRCFSV